MANPRQLELILQKLGALGGDQQDFEEPFPQTVEPSQQQYAPNMPPSVEPSQQQYAPQMPPTVDPSGNAEEGIQAKKLMIRRRLQEMGLLPWQ